MAKISSIRAELRKVDRDIQNGLDFSIADRVGGLFKLWISTVGEEITCCPDDGPEYDAWIIPKSEIRKLPGSLKVKNANNTRV